MAQSEATGGTSTTTVLPPDQAMDKALTFLKHAALDLRAAHKLLIDQETAAQLQEKLDAANKLVKDLKETGKPLVSLKSVQELLDGLEAANKLVDDDYDAHGVSLSLLSEEIEDIYRRLHEVEVSLEIDQQLDAHMTHAPAS